MIPGDWWDGGLWNLVVTLALAITVLLLVRWRKLQVEPELAISGIRATVQLLAMALLLVAIFNADSLFELMGTGADIWFSVVVLICMGLFAAHTSAQRARPMPRPLQPALVGVLCGPGLVLLFLALTGGLPLKATFIIPVGSMAIGNGMVINSLTLDRLKAEVRSNRARLEATLALGATGVQALAPQQREALQASLIPYLDRLKTLGLVWIPGAMTGMLLAGEDPIWAATFQVLIMFMVMLSGLASAMATAILMGRKLFTENEQLVEF